MSLATVAPQLLVELQTSYIGAPSPPAEWRLLAGEEVAHDVDAYVDMCCRGLGFVIVSGGQLKEGVVDHGPGPLFTVDTVAMGVLRCAPAIDDHLRSPTQAEQAVYALQVFDDRDRILKAVLRVAEWAGATSEDMSDPVWSALPVEGGCGGVVVTFDMNVLGEC